MRIGRSGVLRVPVVDKDFGVLLIKDGVVVGGRTDLPRSSLRIISRDNAVAVANKESDAVPPELGIERHGKALRGKRRDVQRGGGFVATSDERLTSDAERGVSQRFEEGLDGLLRFPAGQRGSAKQDEEYAGNQAHQRCRGTRQHPIGG